MNLKKLNEELDKLLMHELSPETRQWATDEREARYLAAQATADREKEKFEKNKQRKTKLSPKTNKEIEDSLTFIADNLSDVIGTNFSDIKEENGNFVIIINDADLENGKLTKSAEQRLKELLEEMSEKYGCKYTYKVTGTKVEIICEKPKIANSNGKTFADWFGEDLTGQTYEGGIDCSGQGLTSLKGAPQKVRGHFICEFNKLTTLQGAPQYVGKSFMCGYNHLSSLEGAPQYVDAHFWCNHNKLTTLEGAPEKVRGHFMCEFNKLTTLEGAPKYVGKDFHCNDNNLTSLKGAPEYVGRVFECRNNPNLKSLEGIGEVEGEIRSDYKTKE